MSVNHYAFGNFPGGDTEEGLHIGQAAGGSRYLFHSVPELGLTTYQAWYQFLRQPGVTIKAESGYDLTSDQMDATMTEARDSRGWPLRARVIPGRPKPGYHLDGPHAFYEGEFC